MKKTNALMTPAQVADYLGIHLDTVYRWLQDGKLPGFRIGGRAWRIRRSALEAMMEADHARV